MLSSITATAASSHASIFHDRNAVHQQNVPSKGIISTVAGSINNKGSVRDGIAATATKLTSPEGVTMDASGNLYISDRDGYKIVKVTASTGIMNTLAGTGFADFAGDGAQAIYAAVNKPEGIQVDKSGNIFFADVLNHRIR